MEEFKTERVQAHAGTCKELWSSPTIPMENLIGHTSTTMTILFNLRYNTAIRGIAAFNVTDRLTERSRFEYKWLSCATGDDIFINGDDDQLKY